MAMATTTNHHPVPEAQPALARMRKHLAGPLIEPPDAGYDQARAVWNGMVDRYPLAIARAATVDDVPIVLEAARETGLPLAVRGGGHSITGLSTVDDGIVLDLGDLREVVVDPATQLVTVAPGARAADVDAATAPHRLAIPLGASSLPGVAGLTLGGGVGWLTRRAGLALDCLVRAEVVTAQGEHLVASREEHPDLFWGLRGGGGNFGVVTSFTFRAVRLPQTVLGWTLVYAPSQWWHALAAFERWARELPDELSSILTFRAMPEISGMGEETCLMVRCVYVGEAPARGTAMLDRLRRAAPPVHETSGPISWPQWQSVMDAHFPFGSHGFWRNVAFTRMDEDAVGAVLDVAERIPGPGHAIDIHHLGGAFARVPEQATAFPNRTARFWMNIYGAWQESEEDPRGWDLAGHSHAVMERLAERGEYVNFRALEYTRPITDFTRQIYGEEKYRRLQHVKQRYDPQNLFRGNYNVSPDV